MVLWRPGLRLDAPGVDFPLSYRKLDNYTTNQLLRFTSEASRIYDRHQFSRRYTRASLTQLFSSIKIAWNIIDERRVARRTIVIGPDRATNRTVFVDPSFQEKHIYLSPWVDADSEHATDNKSEWSTEEQSSESEEFTDDELTRRKGKQQNKLSGKKRTQVQGKAKQHKPDRNNHEKQPKHQVSPVRKRRQKTRDSACGRKQHEKARRRQDVVDIEDEQTARNSECRNAPCKAKSRRSNQVSHSSASSDSELSRRRTRHNKKKSKGKRKGRSKSESPHAASTSEQHGQAHRPNDKNPDHSASPPQHYPSPPRSHTGPSGRHNEHVQTPNQRRSTPYSYSGSQLPGSASDHRERPPRHENSDRLHYNPDPPKPPSPITTPIARFNPYTALALSPTAPTATIKATVKALWLQYHHDKQHGKSEAEVKAANVRMCEINRAKGILLDELRKKAYDEDGVVNEAEFEAWLERQQEQDERGKKK